MLLLAAFPVLGIEIPALAWIALVPLLLALRGASRTEAFALGLSVGAVFMGGIGWWLMSAGVHPAAWTLLLLMCSLYTGVFALVARQLRENAPRWAPLTLPAAWTVLEFARANMGWLATPWGLLGYSQYQFLPILPLASVAGVYGVSFAIASVNAVVAEAIGLAARRAIPRAPTGAPYGSAWASAGILGSVALLWLAQPLSGATEVAPEEGQSLRVAIVQAGISEADWSAPQRAALFQRYVQLSREAAVGGVDLVIWPESAVPAAIPADPVAVRMLGELAAELGSHLIVSTTGRDKNSPGRGAEEWANSSFLFTPEGEIAGRYDKIRLLPFNEYVPLRSTIPWPSWIVSPEHRSDAVAGTERSVFAVDGARFGVLICYENSFASEFRASAARGVDFMISMTNESFTASHSGHAQMFAINVFRAVENGVSVVRAATTGVSALILPDGRIAGRVRDESGRELGIVGSLVGEIPLAGSRPPYTQLGDAPLVLLAFIVVVGLVGPARTSSFR